jgi:hypothetical protein
LKAYEDVRAQGDLVEGVEEDFSVQTGTVADADIPEIAVVVAFSQKGSATASHSEDSCQERARESAGQPTVRQGVHQEVLQADSNALNLKPETTSNHSVPGPPVGTIRL